MNIISLFEWTIIRLANLLVWFALIIRKETNEKHIRSAVSMNKQMGQHECGANGSLLFVYVLC